MSKKLEYTATNTATNTGRPFSITEMIIAAKLRNEGYASTEIKEKSVTEK